MNFKIYSILCGGFYYGAKLPEGACALIDNRDNKMSPCQAYQRTLDEFTQEWTSDYGGVTDQDILILIHDDVTIHDKDWLARVLQVFADRPECVSVGLGGAVGLGSRDLYRKPYDIWNLARRGYASNQTDWGTHGALETDRRRVAVLDAFFLAVRVDWLRSVGGWPVDRLTHHCLDLWLACAAARDSRETWMVGASCTHHGGGSSTTNGYASAGWLQGGTLALDHQIPHRWIADEFRDVLPLEIA